MTMISATRGPVALGGAGPMADPVRDPVATAVLSDDSLAGDGVCACLGSAAPGIRLVGQDQQHAAELIVVITSTLTEQLLDRMRTARDTAASPRQRMVLVTGPSTERHMRQAFRYGVVSVVPRAAATCESVIAAVLASGHGSAVLPGPVARWLAETSREFEAIAREAHGITASGLTSREADVIRLLANGMSTSEIARKMDYSERTIKSIIGEALSRHNLRNRSHAVAYAYRTGAI
jgi:DNA-binding NarL/FixJ family response regulator